MDAHGFQSTYQQGDDWGAADWLTLVLPHMNMIAVDANHGAERFANISPNKVTQLCR